MSITKEVLLRLIEKAGALKATQLHVTAGKRPTIRVKRVLKEIMDEDVLHVQDMHSLVNTLLTSEQLEQLERAGEIRLSLGGVESVECHIAKSLGTVSMVIEL